MSEPLNREELDLIDAFRTGALANNAFVARLLYNEAATNGKGAAEYLQKLLGNWPIRLPRWSDEVYTYMLAQAAPAIQVICHAVRNFPLLDGISLNNPEVIPRKTHIVWLIERFKAGDLPAPSYEAIHGSHSDDDI